MADKTDHTDYATTEELGQKYGDLQAMDRVRIVGLTSEKGRKLNGRLGTVRSISGNNDGRANPYVARMPDGRYKIDVDFDETLGKESSDGKVRVIPETKTYSLKRENLEPHDVSVGSLSRTAEGVAALRGAGMTVETTAQREAREPEMAGWFPAILQGDVTRTREILTYVRETYGLENAADQNLDATGESALLGAIQNGHLGIVRVLLEFGANPNRVCNAPMMRELHLSYFNMAIMMMDTHEAGEDIVHALLDGGADVNSNGMKGTPLSLAATGAPNHESRMRLCRKLLDKGANLNLVVQNGLPGHVVNELTALSAVTGIKGSDIAEPERHELLNMLMQAGADPGILCTLGTPARGERCNAIHIVVSRREADMLRCLLSTKKGRAAVNVRRREAGAPGENNGDGETAITMAVADYWVPRFRACRDMAVQLLKAGADIEIEDNCGLSAAKWLQGDALKYRELSRLITKSKKSKGQDAEFWDSEEVKAFIEDGDDSAVQCQSCRMWSDMSSHQHLTFQRCSKCKSAYYCSRNCQKAGWTHHKKVCKPSSKESK
mmetsp:Transcript_8156/g.17050  ORF Transcript_8156/g.17050 Transcript_8156/m.17050 type:complete len:551 (+) Transcript_8156:215-1867(+)